MMRIPNLNPRPSISAFDPRLLWLFWSLRSIPFGWCWHRSGAGVCHHQLRLFGLQKWKIPKWKRPFWWWKWLWTMGYHGNPWVFYVFFFCFFRVSYRHSELQGTWSPPLCHRSTTSPPKRAWPRRWLWRPGRRDCWDETIVGSKTGWWFEHVWNRLKYTIIILYKYYNTIYCIFFWIIKVPSYLGMMIHRLRVIETPVSKLRGPWR